LTGCSKEHLRPWSNWCIGGLYNDLIMAPYQTFIKNINMTFN
jgi:hypothetical protein